MTAILIWITILFTVGAAFRAPYVLGLLYVWVDIFRPQNVTTQGFGWLPLSFIVGALAALGLTASAPQRLKSLSLEFFIQLALAGWITYTTFNAVVQTSAWIKWDLAIKTILFSALLGQVTAKRYQVEALAATLFVAASAQIMSVGIKSMFGGGGYGYQLGVITGNDQLAESSMLAVYCAAMIPLIWFLSHTSLIVPSTKKLIWLGRVLIIMCIASLVGTFARAGLLSLAVVGAYFFFRSKNKARIVVVSMVCAVVAIPVILNTSWWDRMSTIADHGSDSSAMVRLKMWSWAIDYVSKHPLGGGFRIDEISQIQLENPSASEINEFSGKAFHSIYFEVLAEHGVVGFALYYGLIALILARLYKVRSRFSAEPDSWESRFASVLIVTWLAFLIGCAFVNVAFMPYFFLLQAVSVSFVHVSKESTPSNAQAKSRNNRLEKSRGQR